LYQAGAFGLRPDNACIVGRVVFYPSSTTRPSLCALEALRGTSGGASMTIPGGAGTPRKAHLQLPRARRIGFSHRVGAPTSGPSLCPAPMP
jgi:hypothetical protein